MAPQIHLFISFLSALHPGLSLGLYFGWLGFVASSRTSDFADLINNYDFNFQIAILILNYQTELQHFCINFMFDQLLTSFQAVLKQAKQTSTSLNKQFQQTLNQFGRKTQNFHDPTHTLGKAVSFPKSQRFKPLQKQQLRTTDSFGDLSAEPETIVFKGPKFSKSNRFVAQKQDEMTVITPNYDAVKRNNKQAPKIVPVSKQQMGKSRLSQATAASASEVGPGKYFVNQNQVANNHKTPSFSKSKRFQKQKKQYQDTPLFVSDAQTKKRPPSMAVLKKKIEKNKKQISLQQQQQLRQRVKFVYWKSIPIELDRLLKSHSGAPLLKQKYFNLKKLTGPQRKAAILMMLNRLNYERGGFQNNIQTKLQDAPCGVVYRRSTPKPFKFSEMEPGPDFYYPQDDATKPNLIGFTFAKHEQKPAKPDFRDYQINEQYFKKGGDIIILPEHKNHVLTEEQVRSLNRGPGFYDCLFKHVQKRTDIGAVKYQQITEKNARQNNCVDVKQVNDAFYFPSYSGIDPKIAGPVYSEPANVRPAHTPQKQLFPEHWLFYDGDLNKVRAEIAKNVLIGNGLNFQEYQSYKKKFNAFKNYMELRRKQAQKLQYNPKFEVIDAHVEGFDMSKKPEKTLINPIEKPQFGLDGDNLLLSPEKLKRKLPDVNFQKMVGRQTDQVGQDDIVDGDVLILQPEKMKKHVAEIDFKKIVGRPQIVIEKNLDQQAAEGDRILIDPKLPQKKLPNIDFSKQVNKQRQPINAQQIELKQQIVIQPQKPKRIKGFVQMQRMSSVRLVPYLRKSRQSKQKVSVISRKPRQKANKVEVGQDMQNQNAQQQQQN